MNKSPNDESKQTFSADWFKGMTKEQQEEIRGTLKNIPFLKETILSIIKRYEDEEIRAETSLAEYDSPSWSHKQADRNGARRALRKVKTLFI